MALFKIPKRTETSIDSILTKVATEEAPKIKLKGTSLLSKIDMIRQTVEKNLGSEKGNYLLIDNDEQWLNYCAKACNSDYVAYDTECDSLDTMKANLAGICIKATGLPSAYVTVGHISPITEKPLPNQVSMSAISNGLEMLVKSGAKFLMHNSYFDIVLTYQQTGVMLPVYFDTLVCAELLNENEQHGLKYLYAKYCKQSDNFHKFAELFDGIPINLIPPEIAGIYGQFDAIMTYDLALWQMPYVTHGTPECNRYKLDGVTDLFWNIDMRMIEVLVSMRLEGLKFDFEKAKELKIKYTKLRDEAEQNFNQAVEKYKNDILNYIASHPNTQLEYPINYNSPVQLKILFYEIAKIPKGLYRKQPEGTGKDVINAILNTTALKNTPIYDVVKHLSDVKMYDKAISSFIDKLSADAKEHDGKIHCSFSLVNTDTGRLAAKNPRCWAHVA